MLGSTQRIAARQLGRSTLPSSRTPSCTSGGACHSNDAQPLTKTPRRWLWTARRARSESVCLSSRLELTGKSCRFFSSMAPRCLHSCWRSSVGSMHRRRSGASAAERPATSWPLLGSYSCGLLASVQPQHAAVLLEERLQSRWWAPRSDTNDAARLFPVCGAARTYLLLCCWSFAGLSDGILRGSRVCFSTDGTPARTRVEVRPVVWRSISCPQGSSSPAFTALSPSTIEDYRLGSGTRDAY